MENKHAGSSFDSWLEEEGILDECSDEAKKRLHESIIEGLNTPISECDDKLDWDDE